MELFTQKLWQSAETIYQSIIQHPFNQELASGNLRLEAFQFYLEQDALYLIDFSRALAIAGSKASAPQDMGACLKFADGALIAERSLHHYYFDHYNIASTAVQAPTCFSYTNFLIATATHRSYQETVAALLPCFWIYREVGLHLSRICEANNPYQKWIDTYSSPEFASVVDQAINLTDHIACHDFTDRSSLNRMEQAFLTSCRLEWMFWDAAYRLETWVV